MKQRKPPAIFEESEHGSSPAFLKGRRRSAATHLFKTTFVLGEILITNLSLIAAFYLIYNPSIATFSQSFSDYLNTSPWLTLALVLYMDLLGMTHFFRRTAIDILLHSFELVFLVMTTSATIAFFFQWFMFPRYVMALGSVLMLVLTILWTYGALRISKLIYAKGRLLVVATSRKDADRLYAKIRVDLEVLNLDYLGWTLDQNLPGVYAGIDRCTEVMVSPLVPEEHKVPIFQYCASHNRTLYVVPQYSELVLARFRIVRFSDMPTFMVDSRGLSLQQRAIKRTFDLVFAVVFGILSLPVQALTALAVRLDSQGPVLYSQDRLTIHGRVYRVYKFRTMVHDAEQIFGAYQATPDDPRITRVGRFLRATHLDELPQFWNILVGEMSVVGPRSDRPTTVGGFESRIPGYTHRLKVKSGLTGMAQIYGKYDSDPEDKLRFDMMYIKNYSVLLDLQIVLRTIRELFPASDGKVGPWEPTEVNPEFSPTPKPES
jgi:exopolysaccharide biosynthesis polyprenyl glycosylphosphotransferase